MRCKFSKNNFHRSAIDPDSKRKDKRAGQDSQLGANITQVESFAKHYNKELKVSEEEIPLVLLELNVSAL